jgi:hypothetical protein
MRRATGKGPRASLRKEWTKVHYLVEAGTGTVYAPHSVISQLGPRLLGYVTGDEGPRTGADRGRTGSCCLRSSRLGDLPRPRIGRGVGRSTRAGASGRVRRGGGWVAWTA